MAEENQSVEELKTEVVGLKKQIGQIFDMLEKLVEQRNVEGNPITNKEGVGQPIMAGPNGGSTIWPEFGLPQGYTPPLEEETPGSQLNVQLEASKTTQACPTIGATHVTPPIISERVTTSTLIPQADKWELLESLAAKVKLMEENKSYGLKNTIDMCLVPDLVVPPDFKVPDFEKYQGLTCPDQHLTMYTRKMTNYVKDHQMMIHFFQDSLIGAASSWYMKLEKSKIRTFDDLKEAFVKQYRFNLDIAPTRSQLQNMFKKNNETFRDYALRWRALAAQVDPPLLDKEMITMFLDTLQNPYYSAMIGHVSVDFGVLMTIGERIEGGMRSGKIQDGQGGTSSGQKPGFLRKKEGEVNVMMSESSNKSYNQNPAKPTTQKNPYISQNNSSPIINLTNNSQEKPKRKFDPVPMTYTELYGFLLGQGAIEPRACRPPSLTPPPSWYNPELRCAYHLDIAGHSLEGCLAFKHEVQNLIDRGLLSFKVNATDNNPLPEHKS